MYNTFSIWHIETHNNNLVLLFFVYRNGNSIHQSQGYQRHAAKVHQIRMVHWSWRDGRHRITGRTYFESHRSRWRRDQHISLQGAFGIYSLTLNWIGELTKLIPKTKRSLRAADLVLTNSPWCAIMTERVLSKSFNLSTTKINFKGTDSVSWFKSTTRFVISSFSYQVITIFY